MDKSQFTNYTVDDSILHKKKSIFPLWDSALSYPILSEIINNSKPMWEVVGNDLHTYLFPLDRGDLSKIPKEYRNRFLSIIDVTSTFILKNNPVILNMEYEIIREETIESAIYSAIKYFEYQFNINYKEFALKALGF